MKIYCCQCEDKIESRLTDGAEIYPHCPDLSTIPFWICDKCGNYVGCHHKTKDRTRPLGCIPTPETKNARKHIHMILDPLWKSGRYARKEIYRLLSDELGRKYHTANIRTVDEAKIVYKFLLKLNNPS